MAEIGVVEESFTATGSTDPLTVNGDDVNVSVDFTSGSGVGTVALFRSFDKGSTWKPAPLSEYTDDGEQVADSSGVVTYKLQCTAYTSGTIVARLST